MQAGPEFSFQGPAKLLDYANRIRWNLGHTGCQIGDERESGNAGRKTSPSCLHPMAEIVEIEALNPRVELLAGVGQRFQPTCLGGSFKPEQTHRVQKHGKRADL